MGCAGSSEAKGDVGKFKISFPVALNFLFSVLTGVIPWTVLPGPVKKIQKPKPWKHSPQITKSQLLQMREEFWDTAPHYGGRKEIWDALRAAAEADLTLAQAIVDSAGVIVRSADLTICYDERGAKYELPKYVLSEPANLIREG